MQMPNITQAQIAAALSWLAAQAVAAGWINNDRAQVLVQVGATVLSGVLIIADAIIRNGRSRALINPPKPPIEGGGES